MIGILGGVSPLKARQSSRGGKHAKSATATSKRRGGFAPSKGKRGGGGRNVGGYNVQTRFKADPWVKPPSGGTSYMPGPTIAQQILGTDASAEADASATAGTPAEGYWEKTGTELPSYRRAWDKDLEGITKMYSSFEDYVADIEGQKKMAASGDWEALAKKKGVSVAEAKASWERRKGKDGQWRWVETKAATKGSSSASAKASASSGK